VLSPQWWPFPPFSQRQIKQLVDTVEKTAPADHGLPGYSPDLNPIERLWDWMREEVSRGCCHASVPQLLQACQDFVAGINREPIALVDRLWPKFELDPEFEEKLRVSS